MGCHQLREGVCVAGPCSRQELHRHASILASRVLTLAICPSPLQTPASLETGRRRPPSFASSWCQPFRDEPPRLTSHCGLSYRALSSRPHPASGKRRELLRLPARSSLRDHLSAPGTWLFDVDSRIGARDDDGDVRTRPPAGGGAARPVLGQTARGCRKHGERPWL